MMLTAHQYVLFEFKNIGAIPPNPPYAFMSWCLIKHDNFTFTVFLFVEHDRTMRALSLFPPPSYPLLLAPLWSIGHP
jgi:hypothetical protein